MLCFFITAFMSSSFLALKANRIILFSYFGVCESATTALMGRPKITLDPGPTNTIPGGRSAIKSVKRYVAHFPQLRTVRNTSLKYFRYLRRLRSASENIIIFVLYCRTHYKEKYFLHLFAFCFKMFLISKEQFKSSLSICFLVN